MFKKAKAREPVGEAGLFDYAVGALGRRMRTVRELRRLMQARAHEGEQGERDMDAVVARLVELKYLSDERYAEAYTRTRKEGQGLGRRRVAQDLAVKGVDKEIAGEALAAAFDETDEVELARAYCERKRIRRPELAGAGPDAQKQMQRDAARVMNRLVRAGYSAGAVFKLLREWKVEVGDE